MKFTVTHMFNSIQLSIHHGMTPHHLKPVHWLEFTTTRHLLTSCISQLTYRPSQLWQENPSPELHIHLPAMLFMSTKDPRLISFFPPCNLMASRWRSEHLTSSRAIDTNEKHHKPSPPLMVSSPLTYRGNPSINIIHDHIPT